MRNEALLQRIDQFLAQPGVRMTETTFGRLAVNDGKLVARLRDGKRVWPETEERIDHFMETFSTPTPKEAA